MLDEQINVATVIYLPLTGTAYNQCFFKLHSTDFLNYLYISLPLLLFCYSPELSSSWQKHNQSTSSTGFVHYLSQN